MEEFRTSGLTRREFCSQRGIALTTFDYWRRQSRSTLRLVKVEVARPETAALSFNAAPYQRAEQSKVRGVI